MNTKNPFKKVQLVTSTRVKNAEAYIEFLSKEFSQHGYQVSTHWLDTKPEIALDKCKADMVVVLGGDGTILRVSHECAQCGIPILGIHQARLGFLIEINGDNFPYIFPALDNGEFWIESRTMLEAELWRDGKQMGSWLALNEAFIGRGPSVRPVHLTMHLDQTPVTTYVADGLILATPTGSTAYSLAAGGPILPPELCNIVVTPVAPHFSLERSLILSEGTQIEVTLSSSLDALLSVDGQPSINLQTDDHIIVRTSDFRTKFVRFEAKTSFYKKIIPLMGVNPITEDNQK